MRVRVTKGRTSSLLLLWGNRATVAEILREMRYFWGRPIKTPWNALFLLSCCDVTTQAPMPLSDDIPCYPGEPQSSFSPNPSTEYSRSLPELLPLPQAYLVSPNTTTIQPHAQQHPNMDPFQLTGAFALPSKARASPTHPKPSAPSVAHLVCDTIVKKEIEASRTFLQLNQCSPYTAIQQEFQKRQLVLSTLTACLLVPPQSMLSYGCTNSQKLVCIPEMYAVCLQLQVLLNCSGMSLQSDTLLQSTILAQICSVGQLTMLWTQLMLTVHSRSGLYVSPLEQATLLNMFVGKYAKAYLVIKDRLSATTRSKETHTVSPAQTTVSSSSSSARLSPSSRSVFCPYPSQTQRNSSRHIYQPICHQQSPSDSNFPLISLSEACCLQFPLDSSASVPMSITPRSTTG